MESYSTGPFVPGFLLLACFQGSSARMGGVGQNGSQTTTRKRWLTSNQGTTNDGMPLCSRRPIPSPHVESQPEFGA